MRIFGLLNRETGPWFEERLGQAHTVFLDHWPHVLALLGDGGTYLEYLAVSWRYYFPLGDREQREARLDRFLALAEDCRANGIRTPVKVVTRPDGLQVVAAGNHRAAIAYVFGLELPITELPAHRWLALARAEDRDTAGYRISAYLGAPVRVRP